MKINHVRIQSVVLFKQGGSNRRLVAHGLAKLIRSIKLGFVHRQAAGGKPRHISSP